MISFLAGIGGLALVLIGIKLLFLAVDNFSDREQRVKNLEKENHQMKRELQMLKDRISNENRA